MLPRLVAHTNLPAVCRVGLGNLCTCCLPLAGGWHPKKKWLWRNALLIRQVTPIHKRIGPPWIENTNAINGHYQMEITLTLIHKMQWTGRPLSVAISTWESGNIACSNYTWHCAIKFSVLVKVYTIANSQNERAWLREQFVFLLCD